jgi:hypothetical protein
MTARLDVDESEYEEAYAVPEVVVGARRKKYSRLLF